MFNPNKLGSMVPRFLHQVSILVRVLIEPYIGPLKNWNPKP